MTANLRTIRRDPAALPRQARRRVLEVRGEVLMRARDFDALNARQAEKRREGCT